MDDHLARLEDYLEDNRDRPFKWGAQDCYQFASGALQAQSGRGLPRVFNYATPRGALRQLRAFYRESKLNSPQDYLDASYLRMPKGVVPPSGSVCLRAYEDPYFKFIFGISYNDRVVFPGATGLEFTDMDFDKDTFWVI